MKVWVALADHGYEGQEVLGLHESLMGARQACQDNVDKRFSNTIKPSKPIDWDEDGPSEGWADGYQYFVTHREVKP